MLYSATCWISFITFLLLSWVILSNSILWWVAKTLGGMVCSLYAAYHVTVFLSDHLPQGKVSPTGKAVFITGCDSGFGHRLAKRLEQFGFQVFAGCLIPDGDGAQKLKKTGTDHMHVIPLDVTQEESVNAAVKYIKETLGKNSLWAVVNNAGILFAADVSWCGNEFYRKAYEVNTLGVVRVTRAVLPLLRISKGRVVVVGSLAGHVTPNMISAYCMTKHAVRSFTEGLRMETRGWGISVVIIEPGFHRTNLTAADQVDKTIRYIWETAPDEVKNWYPTSYIDDYMERLRNNEHMCSPHVHDVVDGLENAVCSSRPKTQYRICMVKEYLALLLVGCLPSSIAHQLSLDLDPRNDPLCCLEEFLGLASWKICDKCSE